MRYVERERALEGAPRGGYCENFEGAHKDAPAGDREKLSAAPSNGLADRPRLFEAANPLATTIRIIPP